MQEVGDELFRSFGYAAHDATKPKTYSLVAIEVRRKILENFQLLDAIRDELQHR